MLKHSSAGIALAIGTLVKWLIAPILCFPAFGWATELFFVVFTCRERGRENAHDLLDQQKKGCVPKKQHCVHSQRKFILPFYEKKVGLSCTVCGHTAVIFEAPRTQGSKA